MNLTTPITQLSGVGITMQKRLAMLGIHTVEELLYYFPFRYEDVRHVACIDQLVTGTQVRIEAQIEAIASRRARKRRTYITEAVVSDSSGQLRVVWFGQPYISKTLKVGDSVVLSGVVKEDMIGLQLVSPSYEKIRAQKEEQTLASGEIFPIYSLTAGMTQKQLRSYVKEALPAVVDIEEWLPEEIRDRADIMPLVEALQAIHVPTSLEELHHAERRLKFDEIYILQLRAELLRQSLASVTAKQIIFKEKEIKDMVAALPFTLTKDQKVAAWNIFTDMQAARPMNRLLEGDVGSGKTVVAALCAYNTILNGYQVACMAPTDILARQHFRTFQSLLPGVSIALVTGAGVELSAPTTSDVALAFDKIKTKKGKKDRIRTWLQSGEISLVIGTHALLTETVQFHELAFVIVDEQHRFGVEQRKLLREKSGSTAMPHFLSMTATPIPRSFALTLYGDLDVSFIKEKPQGRKEIYTKFVQAHERQKAYDFIRGQIDTGKQVFVVCPMIHVATDGAEKKSVMAEYEKLSTKVFADKRIAVLHGKMKAEEKKEIMRAFKEKELDILVSTSVIEVGIDIPNASVMMIEGAESFGLAQLHQFRGRVGRSDAQSYCFVLTESDSDSVKKRLAFFEQCHDGFALAEFDLEERGPGEVYGVNQSGMMQFRLASMKDRELIVLARELAKDIDFTTYPLLKEKVHEWEQRVHLE